MANAGGLTANVATAQALAGAGPENTTLPNALPGFFLGGLVSAPEAAINAAAHGSEAVGDVAEAAADPVGKASKGFLRGGVESGNKRYAAALEMHANRLAEMRFDPMGVAHPGLVTPSKVAGVSRTEQQALALAGAISGGPRDAPQAGIILP